MLLTHLFISLQIILTGFLIYRIQRFLRIHQTWELCAALLVFTFLEAAAMRISPQEEIHRWLQIALIVFVSLTALEPELADWGNQWAQNRNANSLDRKGSALREITQAANALARTKTGALIAFERDDSLLKFGDTGIEINADIKKELLTTLFTKDTPTHDGGVLIRKGKATHCSVIFPLSERVQIENGLGTRHRAAMGLTEKTDAVCLVVSEEEGTISLAQGGELFYSVPFAQLEEKVRKLLSGNNRVPYYPLHYLRRLAPKLAQPYLVRFSKSPGQTIYDLTVAAFWLSTIFLWHPYGTFSRAGLEKPLELLLNRPWAYAPFILFGLNLGALFLSRNLTINGIANTVRQERRFLFLPLFQRQLAGGDLKEVILKRERSGRDFWSLALLTKKRKTILIDRGTSAKALAEAAKKIRDVLRIELVS